MAVRRFVITGLPGGEGRGERLVLFSSFVVFVAITLWTTLHHEAWGDEAYPWMLARDAPFSELLFASANRGIPLLFDLSLMPAARAGLPYTAMQLQNLVYVWMAVLLLFRSHAFSIPVRILFAFSYFPAFEFSVIARPYGLQMLLMFAMAAAWRERDTHPLRVGFPVALLANTTTLGLLTAAVSGALLLREWIRSRVVASHAVIVSIVVMLGGGLMSVSQLWPPAAGQGVAVRVTVDTVWYAITNAFFPDARIDTFLLPALIVLGIVTFAISRSLVALLFLYVSGAAIMMIYVFIWMGGVRHAGLLLVLVLTAVWIGRSYAPYRRADLLMAALAVSLVYSILPAAKSWVAETGQAFSGSREVAKFLIDSGVSGKAVLVARETFAPAPLVYLPDDAIYHPAKRLHRTYSLWFIREFESDLTPESFLHTAEVRLEGRRWLYIANTEIPESKRGGYRLLFRTGGEIWAKWSERYLVYEKR